MKKSLAILGGGGGIGRALTKAALSENWHVTILDLKKNS
jgi:NAD(P)-dependent dehydrogenase (short-subunit alcohol dehydrogenase family)